METLQPVTPHVGPIERFNEWMEDLFEGKALTGQWWPRADVRDNIKETVYVLELPGMNMEDIEVQILNEILTIRGKRAFREEVRKEDYVRLERQYGNFVRSFRLAAPTDPKMVKATYRDGLLNIVIPKTETKPGHRIAIEPK